MPVASAPIEINNGPLRVSYSINTTLDPLLFANLTDSQKQTFKAAANFLKLNPYDPTTDESSRDHGSGNEILETSEPDSENGNENDSENDSEDDWEDNSDAGSEGGSYSESDFNHEPDTGKGTSQATSQLGEDDFSDFASNSDTGMESEAEAPSDNANEHGKSEDERKQMAAGEREKRTTPRYTF